MRCHAHLTARRRQQLLQHSFNMGTFARRSDCKPDAVNVVTEVMDTLILQSSIGAGVPAHSLYMHISSRPCEYRHARAEDAEACDYARTLSMHREESMHTRRHNHKSRARAHIHTPAPNKAGSMQRGLVQLRTRATLDLQIFMRILEQSAPPFVGIDVRSKSLCARHRFANAASHFRIGKAHQNRQSASKSLLKST